MSAISVASAGDNAAMESFFALLQKNVLDPGAGTPARNSASRSSSGSRPRTGADAVNAPWASSPRSS
jgi:hypothetical protein